MEPPMQRYNAIERSTGPLGRERLQVKVFRTRDEMHKFLNRGSNSLTWRESHKGLSEGAYAYAGGRWHNVKHLDALTLAHV
jgi:hypothetical protein